MTRASILERVQIGVESTPGTKVAATRALSSMQIAMGVRSDTTQYRPTGVKYPTVSALNKEWSEGISSGPISYREIIYPLSSVLLAETPTSGSGDDEVWSFSPSSIAADTKKSFTIEGGSATRAQRYGYCLWTGLGLKFTRSGVEHSGTLIGQNIQDGFTLTSSLTPDADDQIVVPPDVYVYMADAQADLGSADSLDPISVEWNIADRFGPKWFLNGSNTFAGDVETEPSLEMKLMLEADSTGMGLLSNLQTGAKKFLRIEAENSVELDTGVYYKLTIDTCCVVADVGDYSDEDGVYAIEWSMVGAYDSTWDATTEVTVTNNVAAL